TNAGPSPTISSILRGEQVSVEINVTNIGATRFNQILIQDVQAIEDGMFQLTQGSASLQVESLDPGESASIQYTIMATTAGQYEFPEATAVGTDLFFAQFSFMTSAFSVVIGNGILPTELVLIEIGIAIVVIVIISLLLYRFRHRFF
ncbi:MAG: hypothetical protein Q6361_03085, partial [Candidatus Hermodarchaeota archaeon]|nr:hypothetical protein [Candidatus Hermodarchaeota archaeon]